MQPDIPALSPHLSPVFRQGFQRCSRTETLLSTTASQIVVVTTGSMNAFFPGRIELLLNIGASQRFG